MDPKTRPGCDSKIRDGSRGLQVPRISTLLLPFLLDSKQGRHHLPPLSPCFCRASIAVFADERRVEPGVQMEASRAWKPAMQQLQEAMAKLATLLDAVVFREMWRAVAVGINQCASQTETQTDYEEGRGRERD